MTAMAFLNTVKKILLSKGALVIYAIAIGIIAWLLVTDATNPTVETTLTVELKIENEEAPSEKGLACSTDLSVYRTIEVKVSGRQSIVKKLRTTDIVAKIDFSKIEKAGKTVLEMEMPECTKRGIKVIDYSTKVLVLNFRDSNSLGSNNSDTEPAASEGPNTELTIPLPGENDVQVILPRDDEYSGLINQP